MSAHYRLAILKNETPDDHLEWVRACETTDQPVEFRVFDLTVDGWLGAICDWKPDCVLTRPSGRVGYFKQMYDERIYILHRTAGLMIYPTLEELLIYENKRMTAYWLEANNVPHPRTRVLYHKDGALDFARDCVFPVVAKTSIGASGSGVNIVADADALVQYIDRAFSGGGITRKWGPNLKKGNIPARLLKRMANPVGFLRYMKKKRGAATSDPQRFHVIFQEYVPCDFEWRCVRIGDSFFGHKKLAGRGEMKSGTSKVSWDPPPESLLDFVKMVTDRGHFLSQAVDVFEDPNGNYLVNELQAFWGSHNPHQMIIDGKPGRYIQRDRQWIFEEGVFNANNSYDLRLDHVIGLLNKKK